MRIEKINEDQIKVILDRDELAKRNIQFSEIERINPMDVSGFFKDIIEQAMEECNFYTEINTPLFIEVSTLIGESVILIITKSPSNNMFNLFPTTMPTERQFKKKTISQPSRTARRRSTHSSVDNDDSCLFSFKTLSELATACQAINNIFTGTSALHKLKSKYYLTLTFDEKQNTADIISILREYGQRAESSRISQQYFAEHGELIINNNAVSIAVEYFL